MSRFAPVYRALGMIIIQGEEDPEYHSYFIAHASTGIERSDAFPV